jgi:hypothetical protein
LQKGNRSRLAAAKQACEQWTLTVKNSKLKIWRENSLFRAEFSLIRIWKFPVPLRRDVGHAGGNALTAAWCFGVIGG